jgi:alanine racemase
MRLELKEGARGCLLVDDAYSNDVAGLAAALEFLDQQDQHLPRLAILSDFPEIPEGSRQRAYEEVIALLRAKQVAAVWAVGPDWGQMPAQEGLPVLAFPHTDALLAYLQQHPPSHRAILVKGARVFALERATACLQRQHHGTRLEINLDALAHNFRFYKSLLPEGVRMMAMVKAFAYGSGSGEVARLLQYHRADYLAVAYADEGVALRDRGIGLPIMVMNPEPAAFEAMARHDLEPEIYSLRTLSAFLEASRGWAKVPAIHLKLNTGMNRLGFDEPDLPGLCRLLGQHPLRVASAFTHLAAADDPLEEDFTREQLGRYERMAALLQEALPQPFLRHALNSPGITRFPQACYDMVRLGIGLYGVDTNGFCQEQLRTVGTLKTHLSQVRPLRAGETVGYGRQGVMPRDGQIGVMAIGYADGFDRRLGNGVGKVLVKGQLAPVIGRVCMDMTMLDLTGIAAAAGDEVVVFGENPSLHAVAEALGTIPYEVLTSVGARVKRIYYSE